MADVKNSSEDDGFMNLVGETREEKVQRVIGDLIEAAANYESLVDNLIGAGRERALSTDEIVEIAAPINRMQKATRLCKMQLMNDVSPEDLADYHRRHGEE